MGFVHINFKWRANGSKKLYTVNAERDRERERERKRETDTDRQTDRQTDIGFVASMHNYRQGNFKVQKNFN